MRHETLSLPGAMDGNRRCPTDILLFSSLSQSFKVRKAVFLACVYNSPYKFKVKPKMFDDWKRAFEDPVLFKKFFCFNTAANMQTNTQVPEGNYTCPPADS